MSLKILKARKNYFCVSSITVRLDKVKKLIYFEEHTHSLNTHTHIT